MARVCTVCTHKDRKAIDAAIVGGSSERAIAGQWGVSRASVQRHRPHMQAKVARAAAAEGRTLIGILSTAHADLDEARALARAGEDAGTLVKVVQARAKLAEVEFGTKSKVETTKAAPSSPEEERAELARLKADIEERERELAGKGSMQ